MSSSINDNYNELSAFLGPDLIGPCDFDFILEEDGADGEPLPLSLFAASSSDDKDFGGLLASSIESTAMDFQFETPEGCDAIQEQEHKASSPNYSVDRQSRRRGKRDRSPSPRPHKKKYFQMNTVNFGPPAKQQRTTHPRRVSFYSDFNFNPPAQQQQQEQSTPPRQVSYNDLSTCSTQRSSAPSSATANQQVFKFPINHQYSYVAKCIEAFQLQKLVESMKRSEMTRRRAMMHRSIMLRPEHQRALYLAKIQTQQVHQQQSSAIVMPSFLNDSAQGSFATTTEQSRKKIGMSVIGPKHQQRALYPPQERLDQQTQQVQLNRQVHQHQLSSQAMTSFFDHSSQGSFADKMRQNRKKISMYMTQINQKTL
mmetsp:Transcript_15042/g.27163  ORF Transcript_15042/g.27163 Transcript_15042/m.27163 type:complete len:369 (-) Transcript_15042:80-1186(-)|eukprot:CAMPEP_0201599990 /NCGR_PEP_ID=MMETSP0492-20130828/1237_1 /ASSEMBLY_ACC=CAM_ASM_000837 /TAXON_ID=420259 /ORGANISM="Thalassiosira gravida, Strain GMp14c1" /LENGTH=368 /DNA_ID=CAMNT_0048062675 /DNA_START=496 /DNA_END=1602 /DNA_ORIENTATION=-